VWRAKGLINGGRNKVQADYIEQIVSLRNQKKLVELLVVINLYVNAQINSSATDTSEISYRFSLVDIYGCFGEACYFYVQDRSHLYHERRCFIPVRN